MRILQAHRVLEGAGVPVLRYLDHATVVEMDPFLMLDELRLGKEFGSMEGFPWHPHHGQATFSYLIRGSMVHEDTLGNRGSIGNGGAQYMEAARGIEHQELPGKDSDTYWGFQLWINLDRAARLQEPTYQNIDTKQIPEIPLAGNGLVRVVSGTLYANDSGHTHNIAGPVQKTCRDMHFLDLSLNAGASFTWHVPTGHKAWLLGLEGVANFVIGELSQSYALHTSELAQLGAPAESNIVKITATESFRALLVSGLPTNESTFWYGPFVAADQSEMQRVIQRYQRTWFK